MRRLTVDGETVPVRIADELVDASALSWAYGVAEEYVPQAVIAHGFLMRASYGRNGDLTETASNAAGFSSALVPFLQSMSE